MLTTTAVGTAGSAYVHSTGTQRIGIRVGTAQPGATTDSAIDVRVTSDRKLFYRVTGGAQLTIGVMGYSMTEAS